MSQIGFKDVKVLRGMFTKAWHPTLISLFVWLIVRYAKVILTCVFEDRDYASTHSTDPVRAFDLRSRIYDDPEKIVDDVNKHWTYDPDRPQMKCAIYHDTGRGIHLHFQVHNNTTYKE